MFLVCGEALFDLFLDGAPPQTSPSLSFSARAGGSPFNVAIGLARLGRRVGYLGGLSRDFLGERLAAVLASEGVDLSHAPRLERPSTVGFVALDAEGRPAYAFLGEGAADRGLEPAHLPADLGPVTAIHMGSYALVTPPTADALAALAAREAGRRFLAVDANLRPTVEPDLALWRRRTDALAARADLFKLSDEDLALLAPGVTAEAAAARWLGLGAGLVVVTSGEEGARAWSASGAQAARPAQAAAVVDSVGAGDAFQAACLAWLEDAGRLRPGATRGLDSEALGALLAFGARAAAVVVGRRGADMPRAADLR